MSKKDKLECEGVVVMAFKNATFSIALDDNPDHELIAYTSGRIRQKQIKIIPGDRVVVEISPYDLSKGRIVYRI